MLVGGIYVAVKGVLFRLGCVRHLLPPRATEPHEEQDAGNQKIRLGYFAVLGATLSPDLSILPIFLIAVPVGIYLAFYTAVAFAASSILTMTLLISVGSLGLSRTMRTFPARYNDLVTGVVIAVVGFYILIVG